jgi:hypothetical protein
VSVKEAAVELPGVACGGEQGAQLGGGVGLADGDGAVVAGEAAGVDEGEGAGERVMRAGALEVIDEDGDAADAEGLLEKCGGLLRVEVVEEEAAADDVDAVVGKREGEGVAGEERGRGEMRGPRCGQVTGLAVEQGRVDGGAFALERCCGGGECCGAAGGYFEDGEAGDGNVGAFAGGVAEEIAVDAVAAEPAVDEMQGAQGACDFAGAAVVCVEPLVCGDALEGHWVDCGPWVGIRQTLVDWSRGALV